MEDDASLALVRSNLSYWYGAEKEIEINGSKTLVPCIYTNITYCDENPGAESFIKDSVVHSHWSRFNEARLLLVESFIVLLCQCLLCHKEPARRIRKKPPTFCLLLAGSLWHKDSWPPCFHELVLYGIRNTITTPRKSPRHRDGPHCPGSREG